MDQEREDYAEPEVLREPKVPQSWRIAAVVGVLLLLLFIAAVTAVFFLALFGFRGGAMIG